VRVASRITTVVVDCSDPERLAGFYGDVLGWEVVEQPDPDSVEIGPPGQPEKGPVPTLLFQRVPDPTPGKNRLHLDLNATDRDQDAEVQRLLGLGATRAQVGQTGEETWQVLADPEGNVFCVLRSRVVPL
jgi:catechol 2,3-dioxygenase-like lactoylglutathione lyase family enzyme